MPVSPSVIARTRKHEGVVSWPYLDTADEPKVTIGVGHMVPSDKAFAKLGLVLEGTDTKPDETVVTAAWNTLQSMVAEQKTAKPKLKAEAFRAKTKVRLREQEIEKLLADDLEATVSYAKKAFPGFDSFPALAQEAIIDMMFNMGPGKFVKEKWPGFFKAVNGEGAGPHKPEWKKASKECLRKGISDDRNNEIKKLFEDAALAAPSS